MSPTEDKSKDFWLSKLSVGTRTNALSSWRDYLIFLNDPSLSTGDQVLARLKENKKSSEVMTEYFFDDSIPRFSKWLEETPRGDPPKTLGHNTACSKAFTVCGFFRVNRATLQLPEKDPSLKFQGVVKQFHLFRLSELQAMAKAGGQEVEAILQTELMLGLRIGDFCQKLKREDIREAFKNLLPEDNGILQFRVKTEKESIIATCHLTTEVYELLERYWLTVGNSDLAFNLSDDAINYKIRQSWSKAFPERASEAKKCRFHEIRSLTLTTLGDCNIPLDYQHMIVGKAVSESDATYKHGAELRQAFSQCLKKLNLSSVNGNNGNTKLEAMQAQLNERDSEITRLKTQLEVMADLVLRLKDKDEQAELQKVKDEKRDINNEREKSIQ